MRAFMGLSMFGIGVVGGLLLLSLGSVYGYLAAMVWGFGVFPQANLYINRRWPRRGVGGGDMGVDDTHYWRTTDWN